MVGQLRLFYRSSRRVMAISIKPVYIGGRNTSQSFLKSKIIFQKSDYLLESAIYTLSQPL